MEDGRSRPTRNVQLCVIAANHERYEVMGVDNITTPLITNSHALFIHLKASSS